MPIFGQKYELANAMFVGYCSASQDTVSSDATCTHTIASGTDATQTLDPYACAYCVVMSINVHNMSARPLNVNLI